MMAVDANNPDFRPTNTPTEGARQSLFPPLRLPEMTGKDAIVLGSGPSLGDYNLQEIQDCGAVLYGAGDVSRVLRLDHYALGDFDQHQRNIPTAPETIIHASPAAMEKACAARSPSIKRLQPIDQDQILLGSSGLMALSLAAAHHHERVFVLGFDGLSDSHGRFRDRVHHRHFGPVRHCSTPAGSFGVHLSELVQIEQTLRLIRFGVPLWSLMACTTLPIPLASEVALQPGGTIDRHGTLMIGVAPPGKLPAFLKLVERWREAHPHQAIVVVTNDSVPEDRPRDVLFRPEVPGPEDCEIFNSVETISTFGEP